MLLNVPRRQQPTASTVTIRRCNPQSWQLNLMNCSMYTVQIDRWNRNQLVTAKNLQWRPYSEIIDNSEVLLCIWPIVSLKVRSVRRWDLISVSISSVQIKLFSRSARQHISVIRLFIMKSITQRHVHPLKTWRHTRYDITPSVIISN